MSQASLQQATSLPSTAGPERTTREYPVREYIGSMAQELAEMARWDGDEVLAELLETVAVRADAPRP